jgi:antitoxin component YwqK of YwqJK toxin-antitoxin module
MNKQILNKNQYNASGNRHGYWDRYYLNGQLIYKGNYINGKQHGYWEWYSCEGELVHKVYFL